MRGLTEAATTARLGWGALEAQACEHVGSAARPVKGLGRRPGMVGWFIAYRGRQGQVVAMGATSGNLSSTPENWLTSSACTPPVMGSSLSTWTIHIILEPSCMRGDFLLYSDPRSITPNFSPMSLSYSHRVQLPPPPLQTLYLKTTVMSVSAFYWIRKIFPSLILRRTSKIPFKITGQFTPLHPQPHRVLI